MSNTQTIKLGKTEYIIIPKAEYLRLQGTAGIPAGSVDAVQHARGSIGATLRAAREHAGLSQKALATALKRSQPLVSAAELGTTSVGEAYVRAVLRACRLPADWTGKKAKR